MKKLMIAAAIVCAAVWAQAATCDWKITYSKTVTQPGSTTTAWPGGSSTATIYVFNAATYTQQEILDELNAGNEISSLSYDGTGTLNSDGTVKDNRILWSGTVGTEGTKYITGESYTFYTAIFDEENSNVLITGSKSGTANEGEVMLSINPQAASKKDVVDSKTYSAVGWYKVESVPEPTSGLLLLLGMAGLALRRRRA